MSEDRNLACLEDAFDAVIFLTESNWRTEPRSNRYHYASRFARRLPVYFVQPDQANPEWTTEASGHPGITLVHCSARLQCDETEPHGFFRQTGAPTGLKAFLAAQGIRRPLLWVYNYRFEPLLAVMPEPFKVFHATEDFTLGDDTVRYHTEAGRRQALAALNRCDLLVAVSDSVRENYLRAAGFSGRAITLNNGCDFAFWQDHNGGVFEPPLPPGPGLLDRLRGRKAPESAAPVALYQGGINSRLDFALMRDLARNMPDWTFWYCGPVVMQSATPEEVAAWAAIQVAANVVYHGMVSPERIAELSRAATVGIATFKDTEVIYVSLPLKAYEYVACGLPVVTPPIRALEDRPDLFAIAQGAAAFEAAIRERASSRTDATAVAARLLAAKGMDYDVRFEELEKTVVELVNRALAKRKKLNVLVLYDDAFSHIKTIQEHLQSLSNHSRHNYYFLPASDTQGWNMFPPYADPWPDAWDFDLFDALVWHYGMPASLPDYLSPVVGERLAAYDGLKVLFIQDEYENTWTISDWIRKAGINLVMTCVPPEGLAYVYPPEQHPGVEFLQTLTGFVPEDESLDRFITPLEQRQARIGYRGRILPYHYGTLGYEKYRIGEQMRRIAAEKGVPVDIEVDDAKRIYGEDWYRFLGSVRATLGTESGSNVFDFDGSLKAAAAQAREANTPFENFYAQHLQGKEDHVRMNQISPKFFEAIRLRTALVCFEGDYSGILEAGRHYIPLKKDFSNADEVLAKLEDLDFLRALTDQAYADVIENDRYSYGGFVEQFDKILSSRVLRPARTEIISAPIVMRRRGEEDFQPILHKSGFEYILNDGVLRAPLKRRELEAMMASATDHVRGGPPTPPAGATVIYTRGPADVRCYDFWKNAGAQVTVGNGGAAIVTPAQPWHYAAGVDLELAKADFDTFNYWLKVSVRDAEGVILMSLFNGQTDQVEHERELPAGPAADYVIEVTDPQATLLLFRNGENASPSRAIFIQAQLLASAK